MGAPYETGIALRRSRGAQPLTAVGDPSSSFPCETSASALHPAHVPGRLDQIRPRALKADQLIVPVSCAGHPSSPVCANVGQVHPGRCWIPSGIDPLVPLFDPIDSAHPFGVVRMKWTSEGRRMSEQLDESARDFLPYESRRKRDTVRADWSNVQRRVVDHGTCARLPWASRLS